MSLQLNNIGGEIALGYDTTTGEKGILLKVLLGENVLKGQLLAVSPAANNKYVLQTSEYDTTCIAAEAGSSDESIWAWTTGSICEVLFREDTGSTRGYIAISDSKDGYANEVDSSTIGGNPAISTHFKEVGHVKETVAAPGGVESEDG